MNETVPFASLSPDRVGVAHHRRALFSHFSASACPSKVLNGIWPHECFQTGCDYDREDCLIQQQTEQLLGTIILQLEIDRETFDKRKDAFLQRFSQFDDVLMREETWRTSIRISGTILNSPVKISLNKDGSELILPWYKDNNEKTKPIG